jgi:hypothetical protein
MAAVRDANLLRAKHPALRFGWANTLHEDRPNGGGWALRGAGPGP